MHQSVLKFPLTLVDNTHKITFYDVPNIV